MNEGWCGYGHFEDTLIDQVQEKTMEYLAEREQFWTHQLRVYVENGANGYCYIFMYSMLLLHTKITKIMIFFVAPHI